MLQSEKICSVVYRQKYISTRFVTDGEFSSLRTRVSKRAISVVQLVMLGQCHVPLAYFRLNATSSLMLKEITVYSNG